LISLIFWQAQDDIAAAKLSASDQGGGDECLLRTSKHSIRFGYRCFDRILLNGLIQPFQQPERVVGFFATFSPEPQQSHALGQSGGRGLHRAAERADRIPVEIMRMARGRYSQQRLP